LLFYRRYIKKWLPQDQVNQQPDQHPKHRQKFKLEHLMVLWERLLRPPILVVANNNRAEVVWLEGFINRPEPDAQKD
jgi:hypothetical protein